MMSRRSLLFPSNTPFGVRLIGVVGTVACEGEDRADIRFVGTEEIALQCDTVTVAHTHRCQCRETETILEFHRGKHRIVFEFGEGVVGRAETIHEFIETQCGDFFNRRGKLGRTRRGCLQGYIGAVA